MWSQNAGKNNLAIANKVITTKTVLILEGFDSGIVLYSRS